MTMGHTVIDIPLGHLERRFAELPRDEDLVMVCQGRGRSLKATYFLMYQGYENVASGSHLSRLALFQHGGASLS